VAYVPALEGGHFDGFVAAVFDARSCMDRYLPPAVAAGEAIQISERGNVFYERDATQPAASEGWTVNETVNLAGASWDLRMWPTPDLAARLDSALPQVVLGAGVLAAVLLGAVAFLALLFARQAVEIAQANSALRSALDQVQTLEGLLPICSYCKRVRDDSGYWSQIDTYLRKHTNASPTHSFCPECAANMYEEWGLEVPESVRADIEAGNYD
jgi:hypothetical protein